MRKLILLLFILITTNLGAQNINYDTLITTKAYKSYYSKSDLGPVIVTYKIFKAGGDCERDTFAFFNDIKTLKTATNKDYAKSGYDKGHMANVEDFAYDCWLDEVTFRYYNCVPQTPLLNRGAWKSYESKIRNLSYTDSLFVICYNHFSDKKLNERVSIPDTCYKFVYALSDKSLKISIAYTNDKKPVRYVPTEAVLSEVKKVIKFE